jgi:hypothetical protein
VSRELKQPSRILAFLRLVVVAAAGVGGWFAYDEYVAAEDADAIAAETEASDTSPTAVPPWPADLVVATETWEQGYVVTLQPEDDVIRQQMEFDASSGRSKMTLFAPDSTIAAVVEVDDDEVWFDEDSGFVQPAANAAVSATDLRSAAYTAPAPTMYDVLDPAVWEYTRFRGEAPGPSASMPTRILTFTIKGAAFADAEPTVAAQWRQNSYLENLGVGPTEVDIEVDADGHVVSLTNHSDDSPVLYRFEPLEQIPPFTSPISS